VYTTPDRYEEILRKFIKRTRNSFPGCGIVLIPTLVNETFVENKTPGAVTNIIMYNKILRDNAKQYDCNYLDVYELFSRNPNLFVNDGYHLSVEGNAVLSREIIELFKPKSRV
jgi:lysophospholipase L1-like esterase